jgi:hypothetical protein
VAVSYTKISSRQTVQVLGQTESADVEAVSVLTSPSGIYTIVLVPLTQWQAGNEDAYIMPTVELLEQMIAGGLVTKAVYVQSTDQSDLLAGFMQVTISYTPPTGLSLPFTTKLLVPMTALVSLEAFGAYSASAGGQDPIELAYNQLVRTAGGPASAFL